MRFSGYHVPQRSFRVFPQALEKLRNEQEPFPSEEGELLGRWHAEQRISCRSPIFEIGLVLEKQMLLRLQRKRKQPRPWGKSKLYACAVRPMKTTRAITVVAATTTDVLPEHPRGATPTGSVVDLHRLSASTG